MKRRDPELGREYLDDASVRFREGELKAGKNNSEMMAFDETKLKRLLNCSVWVKRILTIESNYERMASG